MKQELKTINITKEEAEKLTSEIAELLKADNNRFWEISERLDKIKKFKGYLSIINPRTNESFKTFEEYCVVSFELARTTAFYYLRAREYLDNHHPEVQPSEHLDYSKIALLDTIDKPEFKEEWKELDKQVFENKISKRELEEKINNIKKEYNEQINLKRVCPYDAHISYLAPVLDKEYDGDILCVDRTRGEENEKICKNYVPTITRFNNLYHPSGVEFSLREYAEFQNFPRDFNFVGNNQEIRNQIGEAVSPLMAEYIIKKYIYGKTYIETFCGAGGFSQGAHKLGKKCLWAIDMNKYSAYSFKLNFPETEVCINDIRKIDEKEIHKKIGDVDFIIGGPPCQGFSIAGLKLSFDEDPRNKLYLDFVRFVSEFKPKQFLMENVPPILDYKDRIISDFEKIGYSVETEKVEGLKIGMKQSRIRVFFIGNLKNYKGGNKNEN